MNTNTICKGENDMTKEQKQSLEMLERIIKREQRLIKDSLESITKTRNMCQEIAPEWAGDRDLEDIIRSCCYLPKTTYTLWKEYESMLEKIRWKLDHDM